MEPPMNPRVWSAVCTVASFAGVFAVMLLLPSEAAGHAGNADPNAIHACVHNSTKVVRIVGVNGSCVVDPRGPAASEAPLHWQTGGGLEVLPIIVTDAHIAQINAWAGLPPNASWNLCYKGTRDAGFNLFSRRSFHIQCDNKGKTFFVAKTSSGLMFGGYTTVPWQTSSSGVCDYRADADAFLFSLTNSFKHAVNPDYYPGNPYAIYDCVSYGPTLGGGHDFYTDLATYASVSLGYSYICRVGTAGSDECAIDLAGSHLPLLAELEVYSEN
jgi:hypothetical protein